METEADDGTWRAVVAFSITPAPQVELVEERVMLHKCANPTCNASFRYLRQGKLFYIETQVLTAGDASESDRKKGSRRLEHYWLCDECSTHVTLTFDRHQGILTVPLPDRLGKKVARGISPERLQA